MAKPIAAIANTETFKIAKKSDDLKRLKTKDESDVILKGIKDMKKKITIIKPTKSNRST